MLTQVLERFSVERVILVVDRGLLSPDYIAELTELTEVKARKLQIIIAVHARRYDELSETFETLEFADGQSESTFAGHRLVVAHMNWSVGTLPKPNSQGLVRSHIRGVVR